MCVNTASQLALSFLPHAGADARAAIRSEPKNRFESFITEMKTSESAACRRLVDRDHAVNGDAGRKAVRRIGRQHRIVLDRQVVTDLGERIEPAEAREAGVR